MALSLEDIGAAVQDTIDRREIYDCLARYCRGMDRLDRDLVMSAYHPDAIDDHGKFVGNPEEFVEWAFPKVAAAQHATQHCLLNHRCDIDGDIAHAETYYMFVGMNKVGRPCGLNGGRYVDRFEKRDGVWRIINRACVRDWTLTDKPVDMSDVSRLAENQPPEALRNFMNAGPISRRDKTDPSYRRPLEPDPVRRDTYMSLKESLGL